MDRARQLGDAPALLDTQHADDVGHARAGVVGGADAGVGGRGHVGNAIDGGARAGDQVATLDRIFDRQRGGEAAAERGGVGEQVGGHRGAGGRADELEVTRVEVEVRLATTGEQAAELHERAVDINRRLRLAGEVNARAREGVGDAVGGARTQRADTTHHVVTNEGAEQAVLGGGAGIEEDAADGARAGLVVVAGISLTILVLVTSTTADADAGLGAGDVEETGAVGRADAHVFDRRGLLRRQIGSLGATDGGDPGSACQHHDLRKLHFQLLAVMTTGSF